jgi:hypothetical protein
MAKKAPSHHSVESSLRGRPGRVNGAGWNSGGMIFAARIFLFPLVAQQRVKAVSEFQGNFAGLAILINLDGFAQVVHHHLAGMAVRHMLLEFLAYGRIDISVDIITQDFEKFFALHQLSPVI